MGKLSGMEEHSHPLPPHNFDSGGSCSSTACPYPVLGDEKVSPGLESRVVGNDFRIRFYSFNMATSSDLRDFQALHGLREGSPFDTVVNGPFGGNSSEFLPDIVFITLPETSIEWQSVQDLCTRIKAEGVSS